MWGVTGVLALLLAAAGACLMYCLAVRVKATTRHRLNAVVGGPGRREAAARGGLEKNKADPAGMARTDDVVDVSSLHLADAGAPQPPGRVHRHRPL